MHHDRVSRPVEVGSIFRTQAGIGRVIEILPPNTRWYTIDRCVIEYLLLNIENAKIEITTYPNDMLLVLERFTKKEQLRWALAKMKS